MSTDEVVVEVGQNLGRVATSGDGRTRDIQYARRGIPDPDCADRALLLSKGKSPKKKASEWLIA